MKTFKLAEMKGGWFIGDFDLSVLRTQAFEVGCKPYRAGDTEPRHVHRVAQELTLVVSGRARMNGVELGPGDLLLLAPGEPTDFQAVEDTVTFVVKLPSVIGDKYLT